MEFIKGKYYTHKRMLDSVIEIAKTKPKGNDMIADVYWYTKSGIFMGEDIVVIKESEFDNWKEWERK